MATRQEWSDVGERVREARLAAGLSQEELARQVGLDRTMIAKIELGTRRIDALELIRLASALNLGPGYFLQERPAVVSRRAALLEEEATEASRESFQLEAALTLWLADVRQMQESKLLAVAPQMRYPAAVETTDGAREAAAWARRRFTHDNGPIHSMLSSCERAGLLVAVVDLPGDGASLVEGDLAVAVVSRLGDPGRRRATAAHELGHVVLGDEYSSDLGVHSSRAERESVIDAFAAELLLPSEVIAASRPTFNRETLVGLAATYRTSWSLAVRQAAHAGQLRERDVASWLTQTPTRAELLDAIGWAPQPDLERVRVPPSFAHAVFQARTKHLVTTARAVELMRGQIDEADLPVAAEDDLAP